MVDDAPAATSTVFPVPRASVSVDWSGALGMSTAALADAETLDDVARGVLVAVACAEGVVRTGLALEQGAGRELRFVSSDPDVLTDAEVRWCQIDGMADVPLARAAGRGKPVFLPSVTALRERYPHLADRQVRLGTRALAALPLLAGSERLGGLLVTFSASQPFDVHERASLAALAGQAAQAVHRVRGRTRGSVSTEWTAQHVDGLLNGRRGHGRPDRVARQLPADATAPGRARSFVREQSRTWSLPPDVVEPAELCVSEIVTNTVMHSGTASVVVLDRDDDRLLVLVQDGGTTGTVRPQSWTPDRVGGRGLLLVEALSDAWSAEQGDGGTTVWFSLRVPPG
jgi:anti-sigma regulatory factor (Ser/Thr protein kinase)